MDTVTRSTRISAIGPASALVLPILGLLSLFPPLATDMYLPAFIDIQNYLRAGAGLLEASLAVFFLGLGVGQLLWGPVSDRYGRRLTLLIGVALYCTASMLLLLVHSPAAFIGLRFMQALGACSGMVVGRAVVSDLYIGSNAARVLTLLVAASTLGPVIAPIVGSTLVTSFGWKSVFIVMLSVGLLTLFLIYRFLPETLDTSQYSAPSSSQVVSSYIHLLKSAPFIIPALTSSLTLGAIMSFITSSSNIFQGVMGLGKIEYGLTFGFVAIGLVVASLFNTRLLSKLDARTITTRALPVMLGITLVLLGGASSASLVVLIVPLWFAVAQAGLICANTTAIAMEAVKGQAGGGSALLGALQFGVAFLCSSLVALFISNSTLPLALGMCVPALLGQLVWWVGEKHFHLGGR